MARTPPRPATSSTPRFPEAHRLAPALALLALLSCGAARAQLPEGLQIVCPDATLGRLIVRSAAQHGRGSVELVPEKSRAPGHALRLTVTPLQPSEFLLRLTAGRGAVQQAMRLPGHPSSFDIAEAVAISLPDLRAQLQASLLRARPPDPPGAAVAQRTSPDRAGPAAPAAPRPAPRSAGTPPPATTAAAPTASPASPTSPGDAAAPAAAPPPPPEPAPLVLRSRFEVRAPIRRVTFLPAAALGVLGAKDYLSPGLEVSAELLLRERWLIRAAAGLYAAGLVNGLTAAAPEFFPLDLLLGARLHRGRFSFAGAVGGEALIAVAPFGAQVAGALAVHAEAGVRLLQRLSLSLRLAAAYAPTAGALPNDPVDLSVPKVPMPSLYFRPVLLAGMEI